LVTEYLPLVTPLWALPGSVGTAFGLVHAFPGAGVTSRGVRVRQKENTQADERHGYGHRDDVPVPFLTHDDPPVTHTNGFPEEGRSGDVRPGQWLDDGRREMGL